MARTYATTIPLVLRGSGERERYNIHPYRTQSDWNPVPNHIRAAATQRLSTQAVTQAQQRPDTLHHLPAAHSRMTHRPGPEATCGVRYINYSTKELGLQICHNLLLARSVSHLCVAGHAVTLATLCSSLALVSMASSVHMECMCRCVDVWCAVRYTRLEALQTMVDIYACIRVLTPVFRVQPLIP